MTTTRMTRTATPTKIPRIHIGHMSTAHLLMTILAPALAK